VSSRVKRRVLTPALLLLLLAVTLVTVQLVERAGAGTSYCARHSAQSDRRAALVSGSGSPVTVVGDSWSVGLGLDRLADSWPSRLPGRVTTEGFSGSGFSRTASPCGDESFGTRAAAITPRGLVVVEGGLNDYNQPASAIRSGFEALVRQLHGHRVLVVGPARAPERADGAARVDAILRQESARAGVEYVSMLPDRFPYLEDGLHLTPAGHRAFGLGVAGAIGR
jgi:acyl-CoA thioesterase I